MNETHHQATFLLDSSHSDFQSTVQLPLLKLPYLPIENAVGQMTISEIYNLSLSSKRSGSIVRLMKFKTEEVAVFFELNRSSIRYFGNGKLSKFPDEAFYSKEEDFRPERPGNFPEVKHLASNHVDECLALAKGLDTLFNLTSRACHFLDHNNSPEVSKQILSKILSQQFTEFVFFGLIIDKDGAFGPTIIDKDVLEYLLNNVKFDTKLSIKALFPESFDHENAFKFKRVEYGDCSWVTIDMLKSVRNAGSLTLWRMDFDSKKVNEFLTYWVNADEDVLEDIEIYIKRDNEFAEDEVLDQLITVVVTEEQNNLPIYFIKAQNSKTRKRILGKLTFLGIPHGIKLESIEANGQYKAQLEILELREKEKDLEDEVKDYEEQLENGSSINEGTLQKMKERKEEAQMELAEIQMKLLVLNQ